MIILTKEQIISMHELLIERTGGLNGVKDYGLLESAINNPFQTFMGKEPVSYNTKKGSQSLL